MIRFSVRRGVGALVTLFVISVLTFLIVGLVPGSPAAILLGPSATPARQAALTRSLGLDQSLVVRYGYWLRALFHGSLGDSVLSQQSVTSLIGPALGVSLELAALSLVGALVIAVPLGLQMGFQNDRMWVRPVMFAVTLGMAIPGYVSGLILIIVFAVKLRWLPPGGFVSLGSNPVANLKTMVLPALTLALWLAPPIVRFIRATTVAVSREDFVTVAHAKGMSDRRLLRRHIAPNAAIPTITYVGLQLGVLMSGAIVIEVIYSLPGMGRLGLNAVLDRDYPVVQGVVLVIAIVYVLVNFCVDVLYGVIDPRVGIHD